MSALDNAIRNMISRGVLETSTDQRGVQVLGLSLLDGERKDNLEKFGQYGFSSVPMDEAEAIVIFPGGDRSSGIVIATEQRDSRMTGLLSGETAIYTNAGNSIIIHMDGSIEITAIEQVQVWAKRLLVDVEEDVTVNAKLAVVNTEETVTVTAKGDVTVNTEANAAINVEGNVTVAAQGDAAVSANTARVELQANMAVIAPGGMLFDTPLLAVTGEIQDGTSSLTTIRTIYNGHDHGGIEPGPGRTQPPLGQMP
jgi:phage baseplate assembly protein V